jgi:DNA replication protein DnaC
MSETKNGVQVAAIRQFCKRLHMPTIAAQCARVAEQAVKEKQNHLSYLEALLEAEVEERDRNVVTRRIKDAHFPKVKTLDEFDFETASICPRRCCAGWAKESTSRVPSR